MAELLAEAEREDLVARATWFVGVALEVEPPICPAGASPLITLQNKIQVSGQGSSASESQSVGLNGWQTFWLSIESETET